MQYNEVFVTGGTGLLGRVCRALIGQGFLPRLLVRTGAEGRIEPDVREQCRVTPGDLTIREGVEMGTQGDLGDRAPRGVWKEQPRRGITFEKANVHATANILYTASVWGIGRLIFIGVAGARPGDPVPFLEAKGRAETLVRGADLSWTVFRPLPGTISGTVSRGSPRNTWRVWRGPSPNRFTGRIRSTACTRMHPQIGSRGGNSREIVDLKH